MSESAPKAEADGPEPGLLRDVFLIDARESVVSLEGWLARLPGADAARARERLVATAQRLEGTAKLVGYPGLARLAGLIGDTLEGASGDEAARRAAWIAGVVSAIRTTLATIADTGVEPADSVAAPPEAEAPLLRDERPGPGAIPVDAAPVEIPPYFVAEAHERLDVVATALEALDREGPHADALAQLLRSTHGLKGAAYTVGYAAVGDLAHAMETLLAEVRDERLPLTPAVVDSALGAVDTLRLLVDAAPRDPDDLAAVTERTVGRLMAHLPGTRPERATKVGGGHDRTGFALWGPLRGLPQERVRGASPRSATTTDPGSPAAGPGGRVGVRVDVERLDALLNLVGELFVARSRLDAHLAQVERARESTAQSRTRLARAVGDFDPTPPGRTAARLDPGPGGPAMAELLATLELERYDDADVLVRRVDEIAADLGEREGQLAGLLRTVADDAALLQQVTDRLRAEVVQVRLVPVGRLFPRVVRQVREAARAAGKAVSVEVAGDSVEVDNALLEPLADPLLHLAQNAVIHGLEHEEERRRRGKPTRGTVRLRAEHRGGAVWIHVQDDGAGIDPERVRAAAVRRGLVPPEVARRLSDAEARELIYLPGLSTAAGVTPVSGRGVGLDVVRAGLARLHGEIAVASTPGAGTTFTVKLPLTLLISDALMVRVGGETLAIPLLAVQQVLMARPEWIRPTERGEVLPLYLETVDLLRLDRVLGLPPAPEPDRVPVVVLRVGGRVVAVAVSDILEKEAIVVKGLGPFLDGLWPFAGGTISPDGRVILVLDPGRLLQPGGPGGAAGPHAAPAAAPVAAVADVAELPPPPAPEPAEHRRRILLVDDSISVRTHVGRMLERAGFQVVLASDGVEARERLTETSVDLAITDLEMPRMNGFELIQELRRAEATRTLPVVVLTTRAGSKYLNLARWLGANHYVAKPVDEGAFVALIESQVAPAARA